MHEPADSRAGGLRDRRPRLPGRAGLLRITTVALALTLAACKSESKSPPTEATPAAPVAAAAKLDAAPPPPPPRPAPTAREGGPTQAQCDAFVDHTSQFLAESLAPPNADAKQLAYVQDVVKKDRANQLRFCLEALEVPEVECVNKSTDFPGLAACERLRRQIPVEMLKRAEVTTADCERFFVRYKQLLMTEGKPAEEIDAAKDQLVRTCEEKARPSTIACFLTATTYEEARRCP